MFTQLDINDELNIGNSIYQVAEHPTAPGMPDGQEGRTATVYRLVDKKNGQNMALKAFKLEYRTPSMVRLSQKLAPLSSLPGLEACKHTILTTNAHSQLLKKHPDFIYAVLMPWITGKSWFDILHTKEPISKKLSLKLVRSFLNIVTNMEENGLAHCDLSSANILLPGLEKNGDTGTLISLVDVEQMFGPGFDKPKLPGPTPGYAHKTTTNGYWSASADRFSGAVLVAEMLGWCYPQVRDTAYGESFFAPDETIKANEAANIKFQLLQATIERQWGTHLAGLFQRAWQSSTLQQCPTFGEWLIALPDSVPEDKSVIVSEILDQEPLQTNNSNTVEVLMELAQKFKDEGNIESATALWVQAYDLASGKELRNIIEQKLQALNAQFVNSQRESVLPNSKSQPLQNDDFPVRDISLPSTSLSRQQMIVGFLSIFLVFAILAFAFFLTQESNLNELSLGIREATGNIGEQVIASTSLAFIIGIVQAFIFRRTLRGSGGILFVLLTTVSGAIGGLIGGNIMMWLGIPVWAINGLYIGALIGGISGALASLGQNVFLRNKGSGSKWFVWNTLSWFIVWGIGWYISWLTASTVLDNAIGAAFMIVTLGILLSVLLYTSPSIEF